MLTIKSHAQTPGKQSPLKESDTYWKSRLHQGLFQNKKEWENFAQTMGVS